jgi:N-acetylglutamate synthase-like GNAT family acetyltransferase
VQLETHFGLTVALAGADEALTTDWSARRDVDTVRVTDVPPGSEAELTAAGFVVKPEWLIWLAPVGATEEEFLAALSSNARHLFRKSLRRTAHSRTVLTVDRPVRPRALDEFLAVYGSRIGRMRNGILLAPRERERFLAGGDEYLMVSAVSDGRLVGGCICHWSAAASMVRVRFVAVSPEYQRDSLTRSIYAAAFQAARDLGCTTVSLGVDYNLYGQVVLPGLFGFKAQLGFSAVPVQQVLPADGTDVAERILRLDNLTDPSLMLGYDRPGSLGGTAGLHGEIYTTGQGADVRSLTAHFLTGVRVTTLES